jgi:hypothetical protein
MDVLLKNVTMVTEVENLRVVFQAKKEQLWLVNIFIQIIKQCFILNNPYGFLKIIIEPLKCSIFIFIIFILISVLLA